MNPPGPAGYDGLLDECRMKELIEEIAKALVDIPEEVAVREVQGEEVTVLELKVARTRFGKSHRQTGPLGTIHSHHFGCRWHEAETSFHSGNPRVNLLGISYRIPDDEIATRVHY